MRINPTFYSQLFEFLKDFIEKRKECVLFTFQRELIVRNFLLSDIIVTNFLLSDTLLTTT